MGAVIRTALVVALLGACGDSDDTPLRLRMAGTGTADRVTLHLFSGATERAPAGAPFERACPCEDQTVDIVVPDGAVDPLVIGLAFENGTVVRRASQALPGAPSEVTVTFGVLPCLDADGDGFCSSDTNGLADCDDADSARSPLSPCEDVDVLDVPDVVDADDVPEDADEVEEVADDGAETPDTEDVVEDVEDADDVEDEEVEDTGPEVVDDTGPEVEDTGPDVVECVPQCSGLACGPDGCGGTCAPGCGANQGCANGACLGAAQGEYCDAPIVSQTAISLVWSTAGAKADLALSAGAACAGVDPAKTAGPDHVVRMDPIGPTTYTATLGATFPASLWAFTNCGLVDDTCLGYAQGPGAQLEISVDVGQSVFFVVDGAGSGDYALTITTM